MVNRNGIAQQVAIVMTVLEAVSKPMYFNGCTTQIMDAGKYPQVTLISAAARERMNQLDVTCNLLLFVMMKITQLFPTRLKKVKNKPSIQYQTNSILYCL